MRWSSAATRTEPRDVRNRVDWNGRPALDAANVAEPDGFQVPPLVGVGWRTPLMHNGCAATLADRFGVCSTAGHGTTAQLSSANLSDLTAYLESL